MATQADVDALKTRLDAVKAAIDALPINPSIDLAGITQSVTDVEAAVAAKSTPPA